MRNFQRFPKRSLRAILPLTILRWVLLSMFLVPGPADGNERKDRFAGLDFPACISPGDFSGAFGCTIVMAARNGLVLAGNNEDRNHPKTIVTFLPATSGYYGRVVFGFDDGPVQGGMNDQGLFIDGNALAPTGWKPDPDKPTFRGNVMMVILGTCATCDDVKAFFEKSNFYALERARFPVADRSGASMVVEYGQGRVQFVRSSTWYQIATNFVMSNISDGNYPCRRYRAADKILSGAKELSRDLIRDVLEKTHLEGESLTVYSNIYDLKNGLIYLYNLRDFKEAVVLNLVEELKKGERRLELPALFKGPGEKARRNILTAGLESVVDIRIADAFEEIPQIKGEFDFVFIDAWKPDYVKFLSLLRDRVVMGGAFIGHNVANYARDMRDYLAAVQNDPGLETTFEELTVEGMSVSIVRRPK